MDQNPKSLFDFLSADPKMVDFLKKGGGWFPKSPAPDTAIASSQPKKGSQQANNTGPDLNNLYQKTVGMLTEEEINQIIQLFHQEIDQDPDLTEQGKLMFKGWATERITNRIQVQENKDVPVADFLNSIRLQSLHLKTLLPNQRTEEIEKINKQITELQDNAEKMYEIGLFHHAKMRELVEKSGEFEKSILSWYEKLEEPIKVPLNKTEKIITLFLTLFNPMLAGYYGLAVGTSKRQEEERKRQEMKEKVQRMVEFIEKRWSQELERHTQLARNAFERATILSGRQATLFSQMERTEQRQREMQQRAVLSLIQMEVDKERNRIRDELNRIMEQRDLGQLRVRASELAFRTATTISNNILSALPPKEKAAVAPYINQILMQALTSDEIMRIGLSETFQDISENLSAYQLMVGQLISDPNLKNALLDISRRNNQMLETELQQSRLKIDKLIAEREYLRARTQYARASAILKRTQTATLGEMLRLSRSLQGSAEESLKIIREILVANERSLKGKEIKFVLTDRTGRKKEVFFRYQNPGSATQLTQILSAEANNGYELRKEDNAHLVRFFQTDSAVSSIWQNSVEYAISKESSKALLMSAHQYIQPRIETYNELYGSSGSGGTSAQNTGATGGTDEPSQSDPFSDGYDSGDDMP